MPSAMGQEQFTSTTPWNAAVATPVLTGCRITRTDRRALGELRLGAAELQMFAAEGLAIVVDDCAAGRAVSLLLRASRLLQSGLTWLLVEDFESQLPPAPFEFFVHPGHSAWSRPHLWKDQGVRGIYLGVNSLRTARPHSPTKAAVVQASFCPWIAIVDAELNLLRRPGRSTFDRCWTIRGLRSSIAAQQAGVPVLVFIRGKCNQVATGVLQRALGASGLIYLDGATVRAGALDDTDVVV